MSDAETTAQQDLPLISIVMPAYNEERHLPAALTALAALDYPRDRFEVVLVDNGSTDRTVVVASGFAERLNLRVVSKLGGSIADVRNFGASLSRGNILVFLDCDCVVPRHWLRAGASIGSQNMVWGAYYSTPASAGWVSTVWEQFQARQVEGPVPFIPSGNLWLYKSSFEEIGKFSAAQQTSEDVELCNRARQHGLRVEAYPDLSVLHYGVPEGLRRFYLQNRWHGKHVLKMFVSNLPRLTYLPLLALSFYVAVFSLVTLVGLGMALYFLRPLLFLVPLLLLLLPALMLAFAKAIPRGRPSAIPQLFVLYATYLLARAAALVQSSVPRHR